MMELSQNIQISVEVVAAVIPARRGSAAEESEAVVAGIVGGDEEEDNEVVVAIESFQTEIVMDDDEVVDAIDSSQTEIVNDDAGDETNPMDAEQRSGVMVGGVRGFVLLQLAFRSIGVVYGDIGTSPLYVFLSTFSRGIKHEDDILGVLGLIYYTLTLIPLIKYICIVLRAHHNGEGGTFAMYSLVCEHCKMGRYPKFILFVVTMIGTAMIIGDGVLTPSISVLSAVGGIRDATTKLTDGVVLWISVSILVCLFAIQRFGTGRVSYFFAPIISLWFLSISTIGIYNSVTYDPTVVKAFLPSYIVNYFIRNTKDAWISLGGIVLTVTGTELKHYLPT